MLGDGLVPTALAATVKVRTLVLAPRTMSEGARQLVDAMPSAQLAEMDAPIHELSPGDIAPLLTSYFAETDKK